MNLQKIPLNTVRQFFIQDVVLADHQDLFTAGTPQVTKKVEDFCQAKVKHGTHSHTPRTVIPHAQPLNTQCDDKMNCRLNRADSNASNNTSLSEPETTKAVL